VVMSPDLESAPDAGATVGIAPCSGDAEDAAPTRDSLRALLTLRFAPGVGDRRQAVLLLRNGSPAAALGALERSDPRLRARLASSVVQRRIEHALRAVETTPDLTLLCLTSSAYPERLRDLHDPPALLFARGNLDLLALPTVAIVGTRAHTAYGADVARSVGADMARAGALVISGLAHGIDRFAHEATLDAGGATAAVVGCGIDVVYPRHHAMLHERIARDGLLLSEFLPGTPPLAHHFPQRNRIIAALANVVVIVEAPSTSGALITVRQAIDIGREVLAVPGPIGRRTSEGTNALLRDGAALLLDPMDAFHVARAAAGRNGAGPVRSVVGEPEFGAGLAVRRHTARRPAARIGRQTDTDRRVAPADPQLAAVWATLGDEPAHVDAIAGVAGISPALAVAALLELEITGHATQSPGLRFARPGPGIAENAQPGH